MNKQDDVCRNCRHFDPLEQEGGDCRRYPPVLVGTDDDAYSAFPGTKAEWTCGEFDPRVH